MSIFKYRNAHYEDIPAMMTVIGDAQGAMQKLEIDQWQNGYPNETIFMADIAKGQGYIFSDHTAIVGVVTVSFEPENCYRSITGKGWLTDCADYAVIHRMAVLGAYRGSGLANEMLSFAARLCEERGLASLRADTHRGNFPMQKLLTKNSFVYCGEIDLGESDGDAIRMAFEKKICV